MPRSNEAVRCELDTDGHEDDNHFHGMHPTSERQTSGRGDAYCTKAPKQQRKNKKITISSLPRGDEQDRTINTAELDAPRTDGLLHR